jgi:aldose 1-epimerase
MQFLADELLLQNEHAQARVSRWGATLTHLVIDGVEVIAHATKLDVQDSFAGVTLAPWPNRLANGTWKFDNQELSAEVNDGKSNANHGLVFNRKFEVVSQTQDSVSFCYLLGSDAAYPFEVAVQVSYALMGSELVSTISARNQAQIDVPVAFGSHPYICAAWDSEVSISAASQAVNNLAQIPSGSKPAQKILDAKFSELKLDDCFWDLTRNQEGLAQVLISHSSGSKISVWQDSVFKYLMIYTHPKLGLAVEPQTAPANALNSGQDLIWLSPGAEVSGTWGIRVGSGK